MDFESAMVYRSGSASRDMTFLAHTRLGCVEQLGNMQCLIVNEVGSFSAK